MAHSNVWLALPLCSMLAACSSNQSAPVESRQFPLDALSATSSNSGALELELRTSPEQPPTRGLLDVELTILSVADGTPVSDLTLAVTPWMPAMGHGTSTQPTVSQTAAGQYVVGDVGLFMPGTWQLRTEITGSIHDHVDAAFEVE